jgi:hypothetical protein
MVLSPIAHAIETARHEGAVELAAAREALAASGAELRRTALARNLWRARALFAHARRELELAEAAATAGGVVDAELNLPRMRIILHKSQNNSGRSSRHD